MSIQLNAFKCTVYALLLGWVFLYSSTKHGVSTKHGASIRFWLRVFLQLIPLFNHSIDGENGWNLFISKSASLHLCDEHLLEVVFYQFRAIQRWTVLLPRTDWEGESIFINCQGFSKYYHLIKNPLTISVPFWFPRLTIAISRHSTSNKQNSISSSRISSSVSWHAWVKVAVGNLHSQNKSLVNLFAALHIFLVH